MQYILASLYWKHESPPDDAVQLQVHKGAKYPTAVFALTSSSRKGSFAGLLAVPAGALIIHAAGGLDVAHAELMFR